MPRMSSICICLFLPMLLLSRTYGATSLFFETGIRLEAIALLIETRQDQSQAWAPPSDMKTLADDLLSDPAVVEQMRRRGLAPTLDSFQDAWGRAVKVMTLDGQAVAIASVGENGRWEFGQGDDILIPIPPKGNDESMRALYGSALKGADDSTHHIDGVVGGVLAILAGVVALIVWVLRRRPEAGDEAKAAR